MNEILDEVKTDYYMNVREFPGGGFEAVIKVVKPLKAEQMAAHMEGVSYADACREKGESSRSGFPIYPKREEEEISEFDRLRNHKRAVRRAAQGIRWLCKVMQADRLFTLTYRENQTDREQARADFKRFLRLVRSGWRGQVGVPNWQYVAVLEQQGRGAYHIHCAVKGWQRVSFLRRAWYKALGGTGDESGEKTPGNVDVTNPDKGRWGAVRREWKANKLAGYLTKYLSKTFDIDATEKRRYWHAADIKPPEKQRHWIGGFSMSEAIKSAWKMLELHVGVTTDCYMWVSRQNDVFWISGESS